MATIELSSRAKQRVQGIMQFRTCVLAFLLLVPFCAALAQPNNGSMQFTAHDPCGGGNASFCATVIVGRGIIDSGTPTRFRQAIADLKISPPSASISAVILHSPGGDLRAGMELGREIRRLSLDTKAPVSFNEWHGRAFDKRKRVVLSEVKCLSACAYAFLGGLTRTVEADYVLGIHQFRSQKNIVGAESEAQVATVAIGAYLEEMGVSRELLDIASLTDAATVKYVNREMARAFRVDNTVSALSPWTITALPQGQPVLRTEQRINESRSLTLNIAVNGEQVLVVAILRLQKNAYRDSYIKQFPIGKSPTIYLRVDSKGLEGVPVSLWERQDQLNHVVLRASVLFPLTMLEELSRANKFQISDDFPPYNSALSIETNLSTEGLSHGAALLLRSR